MSGEKPKRDLKSLQNSVDDRTGKESKEKREPSVIVLRFLMARSEPWQET